MKHLPHRNLVTSRDVWIERLVKACVLLFAFTWGTRLDTAIAAEHPRSSDTKPAVAADFLRELHPPGQADDFSRPRGLFFDTASGELLVSDSGHNRIAIFDERGVLKFQFSVLPQCSTPTSLVVDSKGYIYVVGSTTDGRKIHCFDYDGVFLRSFVPAGGTPNSPLKEYAVGSLAIDNRDRLYTIDQQSGRTLRLDARGKVQHAFSLVEGMSAKSSREVVYGAITVVRNRLYVPYSSLGLIGVFDLDGTRVGTVGHMGDEAGGLNFPVAVAVTEHDEVLVLDNNRFNVVCYDANGDFVQEFGGKGYRLGWFYHPTLIALDSLDQVYVGQIYQSWIQVCALPPLLQETSTRASGGVLPNDPSYAVLSTNPELLTLDSSLPANMGSARSKPVTHGSSKETPQ